ncbi:MAG: hypothetical protein H0S85_07500 [Desulfovibrionaceae bacterium]|nr:hypothetical protein [Desulfovibrionaceae bacterium]
MTALRDVDASLCAYGKVGMRRGAGETVLLTIADTATGGSIVTRPAGGNNEDKMDVLHILSDVYRACLSGI